MKTAIALPPFHINEITSFTVETDHALTEALRRYQTYYRETMVKASPKGSLPREMGGSFMAQDKGFQGFGKKKRRTVKKKSAVTISKSSMDGKLGFDSPAT